MHDIYQLKEMLMDELKEFGKKGELTAGSLETVDKLSHAVKNLCKIIEAYEEEEEYSMAGDGGGSYRYSNEGGNGGGSYARGGNSYARGGRGGGSYRGGSYARGRGRSARRDSMGRYSNEGYSRAAEDMIEQLRDMVEEAPDEQTRMEIQKLMKKLEQM